MTYLSRTIVALCATVLCLASSSCIGTGLAQLEAKITEQLDVLDTRVNDVNASANTQIADVSQQLDTGFITVEEFNARVAEIEAEREQAIKAAYQQAKAASEIAAKEALETAKNAEASAKATAASVVETGTKVTAGAFGFGQFGDLLATAALTALGLNKYRNMQRVKRNEPV